MAKGNVIQTNFTSGEVSPSMLGRVDNTRYFNGVRELINFKVKPHGGAYKRHGTKFISEVASSTQAALIKAFSFSNDQSYVIEFGYMVTDIATTAVNDNVIRIFKDDVLLLTIDGTATVDGTLEYIISPYAAADIPDLYITQSADVLYLCHPDYQPRTLSRFSDARWVLGLFEAVDGPYLDANTDPDSLITLSNHTDTATLTASSAVFHGATGPFAITSITKASQGVLTCAAHGFTGGEAFVITGCTTMPEVNGIVFKVDSIYMTATTIDLKSGSLVSMFDQATMAAFDTSGFATAATNGFVQPLNPGNFIEIVYQGDWLLCHITGYTSSTQVTVDVISDVYEDNGVVLDYTRSISPSFLSIVNDKNAITAAIFDSSHAGLFVRIPPKGTYGLSAAPIDALTFPPSTTTGAWVYIVAIGTDKSKAYHLSISDNETCRLTGWTKGTHTFDLTGRVRTASLTSTANLFASTDVGRSIRLRYGGDVVIGEITTYNSATSVDISMLNDVVKSPLSSKYLYDDGSTSDWLLGAWGGTTGWPSCVTFHEQRLVFANTASQPQTVWMSNSADFTNFAPSDYSSVVGDSNSITYTVASYRINEIVWLQSGSVLLIGTNGGEWQTKSSATSEPITPTNIQVTNQTDYGSPNKVGSVRVGGAVIHCEITGRKIREVAYSYSDDGFKSRDLTIISEHILRSHNSPVELTYQQGEESIIWMAMGDGELIGLTYEKDQEVFAWHRHQLGGGGLVESVVSLPPTTNTPGVVYMVVKRTINSATYRSIEKLIPDFNPSSTTDTASMIYLDASVTKSGAGPYTSVTGLTHLQGELIDVVGDGVAQAQKTVVGGAITCDSASVVHVGYAVQGDIRTLPLEVPSPAGSSHGRVARVGETVFNLINSMGTLKAGKSTTSLLNNDLGTTALFTGPKQMSLNTDYDRQPAFYVRHSEPYPLNILSLSTTVEVNQK